MSNEPESDLLPLLLYTATGLKKILSSTNHVEIKLSEDSFKLKVLISSGTRGKCHFSKGLYSAACSGTSNSLELIECSLREKCDIASRHNTMYSSICPYVSS